MSTKDFKKIILEKINDALKSRHFKKKGNVFSFSNGDLTYYIGLQSSQSNTADIITITINTEIASALISNLEDISIPVEHQRHYSRRIGAYLNEGQDKWWTVDSFETSKIAANEMTEIIIEKVLLNFDNLRTTNDLVALWRTGGYIGITERQRTNYLSLLEEST